MQVQVEIWCNKKTEGEHEERKLWGDVYGPWITKETKSEKTVAFTSEPIYYKVHS